MLAAGRGVRFGGDAPKVLTRLRGKPLLAYALDSARESGCSPVLLVVSDERVAGAAGDGIEIVRNDAPERGIASSLQCALRRLEPDSAAPAVVVGLADQPLVGAEAYRRVARAHADGASLAFASYDGVRGNPVLIARSYWSEALELDGDEGARVLFRRHPAIAVPCGDTGAAADVDTPEDLAELESRWTSPTASE
ncbi:MAG: nucleotidyltransferase family protein [Actinomycetota bacterium]|nr:nucleotidyltransferase family protein [Actinomycetota bacterium]